MLNISFDKVQSLPEEAQVVLSRDSEKHLERVGSAPQVRTWFERQLWQSQSHTRPLSRPLQRLAWFADVYNMQESTLYRTVNAKVRQVLERAEQRRTVVLVVGSLREEAGNTFWWDVSYFIRECFKQVNAQASVRVWAFMTMSEQAGDLQAVQASAMLQELTLFTTQSDHLKFGYPMAYSSTVGYPTRIWHERAYQQPYEMWFVFDETHTRQLTLALELFLDAKALDEFATTLLNPVATQAMKQDADNPFVGTLDLASVGLPLMPMVRHWSRRYLEVLLQPKPFALEKMLTGFWQRDIVGEFPRKLARWQEIRANRLNSDAIALEEQLSDMLMGEHRGGLQTPYQLAQTVRDERDYRERIAQAQSVILRAVGHDVNKSPMGLAVNQAAEALQAWFAKGLCEAYADIWQGSRDLSQMVAFVGRVRDVLKPIETNLVALVSVAKEMPTQALKAYEQAKNEYNEEVQSATFYRRPSADGIAGALTTYLAQVYASVMVVKLLDVTHRWLEMLEHAERNLNALRARWQEGVQGALMTLRADNAVMVESDIVLTRVGDAWEQAQYQRISARHRLDLTWTFEADGRADLFGNEQPLSLDGLATWLTDWALQVFSSVYDDVSVVQYLETLAPEEQANVLRAMSNALADNALKVDNAHRASWSVLHRIVADNRHNKDSKGFLAKLEGVITNAGDVVTVLPHHNPQRLTLLKRMVGLRLFRDVQAAKRLQGNADALTRRETLLPYLRLQENGLSPAWFDVFADQDALTLYFRAHLLGWVSIERAESLHSLRWVIQTDEGSLWSLTPFRRAEPQLNALRAFLSGVTFEDGGLEASLFADVSSFREAIVQAWLARLDEMTAQLLATTPKKEPRLARLGIANLKARAPQIYPVVAEWFLCKDFELTPEAFDDLHGLASWYIARRVRELEGEIQRYLAGQL
jgi:hypothetical protein